MSDADTRFHETWLGMVQPIEGLVVSLPVLVEAGIAIRNPPETQSRLFDLCPETPDGRAIRDLPAFLAELLRLPPDLFDPIPEDLCLYVPEGAQTLQRSWVMMRSGSLSS